MSGVNGVSSNRSEDQDEGLVKYELNGRPEVNRCRILVTPFFRYGWLRKREEGGADTTGIY